MKRLTPILLAGTGGECRQKPYCYRLVCRIFRQDSFAPAPFKLRIWLGYATPEGAGDWPDSVAVQAGPGRDRYVSVDDRSHTPEADRGEEYVPKW